MTQLQPNIIFAGRYTLLEKLGIGGYSEVWKVTDNMAGEMLVALKIFAPDKGLDQTGIQVFSKEYGLVFNLNHQNLLKPSHYDIWEGSPYLVMPYCKNGSVYGKLGEMSEVEVLRFISQAASALNYLHTRPTPIIHQDIKPDNFLIDDEGNYLLSDFGISSRLRRTLTRSVGAASSAGTLAYMPTERFGREQQIIPASDIFSLGVTVFELLTERQPFGEHGGLLLKNGADIPDLPKKFSSGLDALVRSCLNADPTLRPDAKAINIKASILLDLLKTESSAQSATMPFADGRKTVRIPILDPDPVPGKPDKKIKKVSYWYLIFPLLLIVGLALKNQYNQYHIIQKEKIANEIADSTALAESIKARQQAILDKAVSMRIFPLEPEMCFVQGGTFQMGRNDGDNDEGPEHTVTISDFYLGYYEVTQKQWTEVMGNNRSEFKGDNLPVVSVSWNDVHQYLKSLNLRTGKNYRLPTEAEWEYVAGGGSALRTKWAGTNDINNAGNFDWYAVNNNDLKPHLVGTKQPNNLGFFDLGGNVSELCSDWGSKYSDDAQTNPRGPLSGEARVVRGGKWYLDVESCRVTRRAFIPEIIESTNVGFRIASDVNK